jgi:hypothetical protein
MTEKASNAEVLDSQPSAEPRQANWRELVDNRWVILVMLFGVTLFLGLPLLWVSRGFSRAGKIVVTLLVLIWTAIVFWIFWLIMAWCIPRIMLIFQ